MLQQIKNRLKSPWLWAGIAGLAYNVISQHVQISSATYQTIVDIASYILLGVGVYSNHTDSNSSNSSNNSNSNDNQSNPPSGYA